MFRTRLTRKSAGSANGILEPNVMDSQREAGCGRWGLQVAWNDKVEQEQQVGGFGPRNEVPPTPSPVSRKPVSSLTW